MSSKHESERALHKRVKGNPVVMLSAYVPPAVAREVRTIAAERHETVSTVVLEALQRGLQGTGHTDR